MNGYPEYIPEPIGLNRHGRRMRKHSECKHEPTGQWSIHDGKSWAECIRCGKWYETTLLSRINYQE